MTDTTLEVLNRRAAVAAVRAEAERVGADPEALLDRKSFYDRVTALDPDDPGFTSQVRSMVTQAVPAARQQPAAGGGTQPRQWTLEDVKAAEPDAIVAATEAGLLVALGYGPRQKRR